MFVCITFICRCSKTFKYTTVVGAELSNTPIFCSAGNLFFFYLCLIAFNASSQKVVSPVFWFCSFLHVMDVWLSLFWMDYVCSLTQKFFSSWSTERGKFLTFIQRLRHVRVMCKHEISGAPALKWDFLRRDASYVWQEKQNLNIWIFIDSIFSKTRTQDRENQLNNWTFCQKTHRRKIIIQSREYVYISSNVQRAGST